jgi:hypothetical protein
MNTQELVQRARSNPMCDSKRYASVADMRHWLQGFADAGILERRGYDDWYPTPIGEAWLAPIGLAFYATDDEAAAA